MTDFRGLIETLARHGVDLILVGGVAATIHGSARLTQDLDVVYSRSPENLRRLARALAEEGAYLRGAPPGLPFRLDESTLRQGWNFTLTCRLGDLDLLADVSGGGTYEDLLPHTVEVEIFGLRCRSIDLPTLIRVKRAAGRPKDLESIAELERILDETERKSTE